jgi:hypothetical protein
MANDRVWPRPRRDDALAGIGCALTTGVRKAFSRAVRAITAKFPSTSSPRTTGRATGTCDHLEALRVEQHVLVVPALLALDRRPHAFGDQVGVVARRWR